MFMGINNGFQGLMLAPTEILATQHYNGLKELIGNFGITIALLTGSTKAAERKKIHAALESGNCTSLLEHMPCSRKK